MKQTLKFMMLFAIGLFLALGITSCGDDDDAPAKTFTITFNTDGGSEVVAHQVEEGKTATKPVNPTKDGFDFEGWYNGESLYNFEAAVTSNLTLTARWKIKTFTVDFLADDNGNAVWSEEVEYGKCATAPENPSKDGFDFVGWYVGGFEYDFTRPVSYNLKITAFWIEHHDFVDLGLPSGTLWATCNVGAKNPWDYGDYFAWGETSTKSDYTWATYKLLTKYSLDLSGDNIGVTDNLTILLPEDDAATVNWSSDWRMPTEEEFQELYENCDWEWTSDYNSTSVAGRIVKSRNNSNSIFLPAAGFCDEEYLPYVDSYGYYWSSSVSTHYTSDGLGIFFNDKILNTDIAARRYRGIPVRPVSCIVRKN